ncbi:hypothetical protein P3T37_001075 [Kitasatospora sp. MAA4]|uniref:DUF4097 family beta strand repeat-containing protein n=1 Tax=Kitasatospora sp. MAA4 TaxID=3035093 RepID=UPI002474BC67|nr:DUF4097 family beta strand repeat-containing protein [Kitasatospora sp. MAA4]MDH6131701.1 hypothetical protein [Kitasatospora sp. MAA4]
MRSPSRGPEGRAWRIVGGVVAVLLLMTGAGEAWAVLVEQNTTVPTHYSASVTAVELDLPDGSLNVTAGPDDGLTVSQHLNWMLSRPSVEQSLVGRTLRIKVRCPRILGIGEPACDVGLDLQVPPTTAVTVRMTSGYGRISGVSGDLSLHATSGELDLNGVSGQVSADVTSGLVKGTDLAAAQVEASATSGRVELGFSRAPDQLALTASSGSVSAVLPRGSTYRLTTRSTSGSPEIDPALSDPQSSRTITATTTSGDLSLTSPSG